MSADIVDNLRSYAGLLLNGVSNVGFAVEVDRRIELLVDDLEKTRLSRVHPSQPHDTQPERVGRNDIKKVKSPRPFWAVFEKQKKLGKKIV
jgi:hypothetical protein